MTEAAVFPYLAGWTVVSLRPLSQQAAVVRSIETHGARAVALPGLRLEALPQGRDALEAALACPRVVFTSPAAVEFADALRPLSGAAARGVLAVGSGTARALAARGIEAWQPPPEAMRSEGVLDSVALQGDAPVGLVTAPGGRGAIEAALRARGVPVLVAHVYRRVAPAWTRDELEVLAAARAPRAVLLTSAEALANTLAGLSPELRRHLLASTAVASSERLAQLAREAGFELTLLAASPVTDSLLAALAAHAKAGAIR